MNAKKITRKQTDKVSISLPKEMAEWLRDLADHGPDGGNVSAVIRRLLHPAMRADQDAEQKRDQRQAG